MIPWAWVIRSALEPAFCRFSSPPTWRFSHPRHSRLADDPGAYEAAFEAFRERTAQEIPDARIGVALWDRHGAAVASPAQQIAGGQALRQAATARDRAVLQPLLVEEWRCGIVSPGTIARLGLDLDAPEATPLVAVGHGADKELDVSITAAA